MFPQFTQKDFENFANAITEMAYFDKVIDEVVGHRFEFIYGKVNFNLVYHEKRCLSLNGDEYHFSVWESPLSLMFDVIGGMEEVRLKFK